MSSARADMPRVLAISHNVMGGSTGMGKTLANMLRFIPRENLAQLYFHSEVPTQDACESYYRITDSEMLRSIGRMRATGTIFGPDDVRDDAFSRVDSGLEAKAYQLGRKRTSFVYALRNSLWRLGCWDTPELDEWLRSFAPDVIFFAAGDYSFAYRIVYAISTRLDIPVVMWCADDFYVGRSLRGLVYRDLMRWVKRLDNKLASIVTISDKMAQDYARLFRQPISVMHIAAEENLDALPFDQRRGIAYIGSLGVGRLKPLLELAHEVHLANVKGCEAIDVYTGDKNEKTLKSLLAEPGVRFHGQINATEVCQILASVRYVLHVESFEQCYIERTRYSLSTKIGESLASGACLVAYGPTNIASIEYLASNSAGFIINSPQEIHKILQGKQIDIQCGIERSLSLAREQHDAVKNDEQLARVLRGACTD